jgi:hypothetical protein
MSFGIPVRNGLSIGLLASTFLTSRSGRLVPRLTLNFLTGAPLDSRITFSRTTNATLVDATGRVTYAPNNLVLYSEEFDNAGWTKDTATVTANATVAPDGTTTADKAIPNNGADLTSIANGAVRQAVTFPAGATFVFSVFAKEAEFDRIELYFSEGTGTTNRATVTYSLVDGSVVTAAAVAGTFTNVSSTSTSVGNGWYRLTLTFTSGTATSARARFAVRDSGTTTGDGTSGIFIWGAQLEQVTYQTLPSTYVQTVASAYYGPRFDYDPVTLAPRGLLIEEQRVNLLLYSEQFDNAGWTKLNGSVTANTTTSPDGTTNADAFIENTAASAFHAMGQAVTKAASSIVYAGSFYVKNKGRQVAFNIQDAAGSSGVQGRVNPATGTVTQNATAFGSGFTAGAITITNVGNGWYRVVMTATSDTSTTVTSQFILHNGTTSVYTGDGVSGAFLWGAQLEAGAFPTSYIPTVASTVTRTADEVSMTGTNFSSWYNQSEGTIVTNFGPFFRTSGNPGVAQIDDGSATNTVRIYAGTVVSPVFNVITGGGSSQAFLNAGIINPNANTSIAGAYALDNFAKSANGNTPDTDASGTVPVVNRMLIGSGTAGVNHLNGYMRSVTYYPTRLTNVQLQELTAPPLVASLSLDFVNGSYQG